MKQRFFRENRSSLKYNHILEEKKKSKTKPLGIFNLKKIKLEKMNTKYIPRSQNKIKKDIILGNI